MKIWNSRVKKLRSDMWNSSLKKQTGTDKNRQEQTGTDRNRQEQTRYGETWKGSLWHSLPLLSSCSHECRSLSLPNRDGSNLKSWYYSCFIILPDSNLLNPFQLWILFELSPKVHCPIMVLDFKLGLAKTSLPIYTLQKIRSCRVEKLCQTLKS